MNSYADIRFPLRTFTLDVEQYADALVRATEPAADLRRFESRLRALATSRALELDVVDDGGMGFVINVLLTARLRNAAQHVVPESVSMDALSEFLQCSEEFGAEQVASSQDASDLADAVTGVLDSLHSYLVAHGLVSDAYLTGERTLAARLLNNSMAQAGTVQQVTGPDDAANHAAKNDLAFAA